MSVYRLMDGADGRPGNGPSAPISYSGNFLAGLAFQVAEGGCWLEGFYWWVPAGGDTAPQRFALWQVTNTSTGIMVPASTVTSGALTADQWNYVGLAAPVALSPSLPYLAATGWSAVRGFPCSNDQFGSGHPYSGGITNGPLRAYSDTSGTNPVPNRWLAQGSFGVAGANPAQMMPNQGSNSANFWVDVQISDTGPGGSSSRLWPSMPVPPNSVQDSALNFTIATEVRLAESCALNNIWFYSPPGTSQLPTACGVWDVSSQNLVHGTDNSSPQWSGAAGSGWVSCAYSGVTLSAGDYKVAVCNAAASPQMWNLATLDYWSTGSGANGVTSGPLTAPSLAQASSPGQGSYHQGTTFSWPDTYDPGGAPCYWVDLEVTPGSGGGTSQSANGGQFLSFFI